MRVVFAFDFDGGKAWWQRSARHNVLGADRVCGRIEIVEVAGSNVEGADAEARRPGIDEVDEARERGLEVLGIVEAGRLQRALRVQPCQRLTELEEIGAPLVSAETARSWLKSPRA